MIVNILTEIVALVIATCMLGSFVYLTVGWVVWLLSPIVTLGVVSLGLSLKIGAILCGASALIGYILKV